MCVGVPGRIVEFDDADSAVADVRGRRQRVNLGLLSGDGAKAPQVDDWVLVHMGFAMERLDPDEAAELEEFLSDLGDGLLGDLSGQPGPPAPPGQA